MLADVAIMCIVMVIMRVYSIIIHVVVAIIRVVMVIMYASLVILDNYKFATVIVVRISVKIFYDFKLITSLAALRAGTHAASIAITNTVRHTRT